MKRTMITSVLATTAAFAAPALADQVHLDTVVAMLADPSQETVAIERQSDEGTIRAVYHQVALGGECHGQRVVYLEHNPMTDDGVSFVLCLDAASPQIAAYDSLFVESLPLDDERVAAIFGQTLAALTELIEVPS